MNYAHGARRQASGKELHVQGPDMPGGQFPQFDVADLWNQLPLNDIAIPLMSGYGIIPTDSFIEPYSQPVTYQNYFFISDVVIDQARPSRLRGILPQAGQRRPGRT